MSVYVYAHSAHLIQRRIKLEECKNWLCFHFPEFVHTSDLESLNLLILKYSSKTYVYRLTLQYQNMLIIFDFQLDRDVDPELFSCIGLQLQCSKEVQSICWQEAHVQYEGILLKDILWSDFIWGGRAWGLACADPVARTPSSLSGIASF